MTHCDYSIGSARRDLSSGDSLDLVRSIAFIGAHGDDDDFAHMQKVLAGRRLTLQARLQLQAAAVQHAEGIAGLLKRDWAGSSRESLSYRIALYNSDLDERVLGVIRADLFSDSLQRALMALPFVAEDFPPHWLDMGLLERLLLLATRGRDDLTRFAAIDALAAVIPKSGLDFSDAVRRAVDEGRYRSPWWRFRSVSDNEIKTALEAMAKRNRTT